MLAEVLRHLRCPVCAAGLAEAAGTLRCGEGHSFDLARQGYVNLMIGRPPSGADSAEMISARAGVLAAGHFGFVTAAIAAAARSVTTDARPGLVLDIGSGTGHHLAAVLDALPSHHGLALDVAKAAVRRAARAHPRAAAAVCDVWRGIPVADGCAGLLLDVFAPRNGAEFHRVLRPDGRLIVVTPRPEHLGELVRPLGLLAVDPEKERRLDDALGAWFRLEDRSTHTRVLALLPEEAESLVLMGPSAWHVDRRALARRLAAVPAPVPVTASVTLRTFRRS